MKAASSRGAYLILDLHRFRAPKEEHVAFWKDAAATYKDNPAVIFELFNEPHDVSWELWRNGCEVTNKRKAGDTVAENAEKISSFQTTGMQALLAAVRSTGAKNLVLAGGLDYAYDDSGVLNGFALTDEGATSPTSPMSIGGRATGRASSWRSPRPARCWSARSAATRYATTSFRPNASSHPTPGRST